MGKGKEKEKRESWVRVQRVKEEDDGKTTDGWKKRWKNLMKKEKGKKKDVEL